MIKNRSNIKIEFFDDNATTYKHQLVFEKGESDNEPFVYLHETRVFIYSMYKFYLR